MTDKIIFICNEADSTGHNIVASFASGHLMSPNAGDVVLHLGHNRGPVLQSRRAHGHRNLCR